MEFTNHARQRCRERGISRKKVRAIVRNPDRMAKKGRVTRFNSRGLTVIVSETGSVVSAYRESKKKFVKRK